MDPISQGVLGATVPQAISNKKTIGAAGLFGWLSGMAPDLDALIRSDTDPLLYLEFHRQFTHSLFFIPFGGFLCAVFFYYLLGKRWQLSFKRTYLFCTLGYATHGLLDACTSYGTQLLWPITNERFAWNTISIIDPIFTLPLVILIIIASVKKQPAFAKAALVWVLTYQCLGFYQNYRVQQVGESIAQVRGHQPIRIEVKPSFANIVLWKVIYEVADGYYTDAVRAGLTTRIYPGQYTPKLDIERDLPWLDKTSQQAEDLERFRWFSKDFLALDANNPVRVMDMRYSLVPNEADGMWSIWFDKDAPKDQHVSFKADRNTSASRQERLKKMLLDNDVVSQ